MLLIEKMRISFVIVLNHVQNGRWISAIIWSRGIILNGISIFEQRTNLWGIFKYLKEIWFLVLVSAVRAFAHPVKCHSVTQGDPLSSGHVFLLLFLSSSSPPYPLVGMLAERPFSIRLVSVGLSAVSADRYESMSLPPIPRNLLKSKSSAVFPWWGP